jgi:type VI secretion system Hcp family effector
MKLSIKPFFQRSLQPLLAATTLLFAGISAEGAAFIKFDGVDGESADPDHTGWTDILSFDWGMESDPQATPGTGAPTVEKKAFTIEKLLSRVTPKIVESICLGRVIPAVVIEFAQESADGSPTVYYRYELKNVLISSYNVGGGTSAGDQPTEDFSLNYEEIKFSYVGPSGEAETSFETARAE